jgi:hypothetical protein
MADSGCPSQRRALVASSGNGSSQSKLQREGRAVIDSAKSTFDSQISGAEIIVERSRYAATPSLV